MSYVIYAFCSYWFLISIFIHVMYGRLYIDLHVLSIRIGKDCNVPCIVTSMLFSSGEPNIIMEF